MKILHLHVLESSARPKLELDESKAAAFRANVFSLLQWSLPFFFYKENTKQNVMFIMRDLMLHKLAQNNKHVHTHAFYTGSICQYYILELSKCILKLLHVQKQSKISWFTITTFNFIRTKPTCSLLEIGTHL